MLDSYVVTIEELDSPKEAVQLIKGEMSKLPPLKQNTVGIISANADIVYSGVYDAVCKELPFPLVGLCCDSQGANGRIGEGMLSILLLTGDDFEVACGHSGKITVDPDEAVKKVKECYLTLKDKMKKPPKLALMYTSFGENRFPSEYMDAISAIDSALPVFGAISNSKPTEEDEVGNFTFCGDEAVADEAAIVLLAGDFTPQFFISSFPDKMVLVRDIGVVTKCEKNELLEINGVNAAEFMKKYGFDNSIESSFKELDIGLQTTAFVFDCGSRHCEHGCDKNCRGEIISRAPIVITDKEMIFAGKITEGSHISIAASTPDSVIDTAEDVIKSIQDSGGKTALIYSCTGRQVGLYARPMQEMETFRGGLYDGENKMNYSAVTVWGEFCPTCVISGTRAVNNEHNLTLIACVFQ